MGTRMTTSRRPRSATREETCWAPSQAYEVSPYFVRNLTIYPTLALGSWLQPWEHPVPWV